MPTRAFRIQRSFGARGRRGLLECVESRPCPTWAASREAARLGTPENSPASRRPSGRWGWGEGRATFSKDSLVGAPFGAARARGGSLVFGAVFVWGIYNSSV